MRNRYFYTKSEVRYRHASRGEVKCPECARSTCSLRDVRRLSCRSFLFNPSNSRSNEVGRKSTCDRAERKV